VRKIHRPEEKAPIGFVVLNWPESALRPFCLYGLPLDHGQAKGVKSMAGDDADLALLASQRIIPFIGQYGDVRARRASEPLAKRVHELQAKLAETQQQLAAVQDQLAQALSEHAAAAAVAGQQIAALQRELTHMREEGMEQVARATEELMMRAAACAST
jgi:hypothetical protein